MEHEVLSIRGASSKASLRVSFLRAARTEAPPSGCVLINSGKVAAYDDPEPQAQLFGRLRERLARDGISSFEVDLPPKLRASEPSSNADIAARHENLCCLLRSEAFRPYSMRYALVGLSLGGQVALRLVTDAESTFHPRALVLLSTVLDAPISLYAAVAEVHWVYGSRDHIVYLDAEGSSGTAIAPAEYGPQSARHLIVRRSQHVAYHILDGCGHDLAQRDGQTEATVQFLGELVAKTLSTSQSEFPYADNRDPSSTAYAP